MDVDYPRAGRPRIKQAHGLSCHQGDARRQRGHRPVPRHVLQYKVRWRIGEGESPLLARLDDGAIPHYYAYGSGGVAPPANASTIVDAGLRALQSVGAAYP